VRGGRGAGAGAAAPGAGSSAARLAASLEGTGGAARPVGPHLRPRRRARIPTKRLPPTPHQNRSLSALLSDHTLVKVQVNAPPALVASAAADLAAGSGGALVEAKGSTLLFAARGAAPEALLQVPAAWAVARETRGSPPRRLGAAPLHAGPPRCAPAHIPTRHIPPPPQTARARERGARRALPREAQR
jgi:hypothetical protein